MPPEPPSNGGYMVAAYAIAACIYLVYAARLWMRAERALRDAAPRG